MLKKISIFGATGSVGRSTADVILANPYVFDVDTLVANSNVKALAELAVKLDARHVVAADDGCYQELKERLSSTNIGVHAGYEAVLDAASRDVDIVMCAISGTQGLFPLIKTMQKGINVAIANKEPLVAAGPMIMDLMHCHGSKILPVDSEHNAIFQVYEPHNIKQVEKVILTASGGPFRNKAREELADVTPEQAINHPNWSMGAKISVDSATLMNKGLEVIEAHYLFEMAPEKVDVVMHPQSIIHSMVSYVDGSILAQLGAPDMKTPIASALAYPGRLDKGGDILDVHALSKLEFGKPDLEQFPALKMSYDCLNEGQAACIALNASNEIAVDAFLNGRCGFLEITDVLKKTLDNLENTDIKSLEDAIEFDKTVRERVKSYI